MTIKEMMHKVEKSFVELRLYEACHCGNCETEIKNFIKNFIILSAENTADEIIPTEEGHHKMCRTNYPLHNESNPECSCGAEINNLHREEMIYRFETMMDRKEECGHLLDSLGNIIMFNGRKATEEDINHFSLK